MDYLTLKWLHVLSSTVLFGTGIGSAFYLLTAVTTRNPVLIAHLARWVVRADWVFTATTAVLQPLTGWWMLRIADFEPTTRWVVWSLGLYALAIACWLPVVWLQMRMRDLAEVAYRRAEALPKAFWYCFACWVALGVPALTAFLAIFWLMVFKPV